MRQLRMRLFRITLVVTIGAGLAAVAASSERQKTVVRERPTPIIATEAWSARIWSVACCRHRQAPMNRPIGDREGNRNKKKIIVCG